MSSPIPERDFTSGDEDGTSTAEDLLSQWWRDFKELGDRGAREHLILHFAPLVKFVAGRVGGRLPANVESADLVSYGLFGLIDAIEKFDLDRGIKFESYAMTRIRGAIIDELRALDWIPRSVRSKARDIERAYATLEARLHRSPTESEIAEELEISVEELQAIFTKLSTVNMIALDELLQGDGDRVSFGETLADAAAEDPVMAAEAAEARSLLARAIEALPQREQMVIQLYYFDGMTLSQIGAILKVTESRISQLHSKAVLHLRSLLSELRH
jgi:RNA polymerase sigma factor FliA